MTHRDRFHRMARKALAIALLLSILTLIWEALLSPFLDTIQEQRQKIADSRRLVTAYQRNIAQKPALEAQLAALRQDQTEQGGAYKGETAAIATAMLQNDMHQLIEAQGGLINSTQVSPPMTMDAFERIQVNVNLTLPAAKIPNLLYDIENHIPYLFVASLGIAVPESQMPNEASQATLVMQLEGYHLPEGRP